MARRPLTPEAQQLLFDESIRPGGGVKVFNTAAAFAADAPKKRQYKRKDFSSRANSYLEATEKLVLQAKLSDNPSAVWEEAQVEHLVALFAVFHRDVYGALPGEIAGDWVAVCSAAKKMLIDELDGLPVRMVEYLQWAFAREKKKERRKNGSSESTWRLGWRWTFMKRDILTDYRVSQQRASRPG